MPERIAKVAQDYAGRRIQPGERFEVEERHVRLLEAIGRLELEAAPVTPPTTRDMTAAPPAAYRTRDIAAAPKKRRHRESLVGKGR